MRELNIEQIKNAELNILLYFDNFCKQNNIRYFLAYGTLIGAIRHKGFIPWDDDIDVNVSREDYCWLIKHFNTTNNDGRYKLIAPEMPEAQHSFVKIVDTKTIKLEPNTEYYGSYLGVDIDVFPLDGQPESEREYNKWYDKIIKIYKLFNICRMDKTVNLKRKIVVPIVRKITGGKNKLLKRAALLHKKYPYKSSRYVGSIESLYDEKTVRFPKEWFDESILVDFEGHKVSVPKEYDKILTQIYGEYMKFPPEEQCVSHHTNKVFALEENEETDRIKLKLNSKGEILNICG